MDPDNPCRVFNSTSYVVQLLHKSNKEPSYKSQSSEKNEIEQKYWTGVLF